MCFFHSHLKSFSRSISEFVWFWNPKHPKFFNILNWENCEVIRNCIATAVKICKNFNIWSLKLGISCNTPDKNFHQYYVVNGDYIAGERLRELTLFWLACIFQNSCVDLIICKHENSLCFKYFFPPHIWEKKIVYYKVFQNLLGFEIHKIPNFSVFSSEKNCGVNRNCIKTK